ncbi:hypothetical protein NDU88_002468 [Pleurodeles waltl]|uniref:Uncharacterized protein n=1 Tax=Pleurodeles waltl TaxID=8319 RepID=A0AAV7P8C8_PLEWA|nr:hypothetical protein NDU88_002468 [Pleurodeles waltl]
MAEFASPGSISSPLPLALRTNNTDSGLGRSQGIIGIPYPCMAKSLGWAGLAWVVGLCALCFHHILPVTQVNISRQNVQQEDQSEDQQEAAPACHFQCLCHV